MTSQIFGEVTVGENDIINLPAKLREHSLMRPKDIAIRHKKFGIWSEFTWEQYLSKVRLTPAPTSSSKTNLASTIMVLPSSNSFF